jgi:hypothetical protein
MEAMKGHANPLQNSQTQTRKGLKTFISGGKDNMNNIETIIISHWVYMEDCPFTHGQRWDYSNRKDKQASVGNLCSKIIRICMDYDIIPAFRKSKDDPTVLVVFLDNRMFSQR